MAQIEQLLHAYSPSEAAWENTIQTIEDVLYPLADWLREAQTMRVLGAEALHCLPRTVQNDCAIISKTNLEHTFAMAAGYRPKFDFAPLPETLPFCALLLLLREWPHHFGFDEILV